MCRRPRRRSPIEALEYNITLAFENPNGPALEIINPAVLEGRISPEIELRPTTEGVRPPVAISPENGLPYICVHAAYLELLWATIYGWSVLFE